MKYKHMDEIYEMKNKNMNIRKYLTYIIVYKQQLVKIYEYLNLQ